MKNKINVLGLGPGNLDYTLPIVLKEIMESEIIIGGKRHIESLGKYAENKEYCYINADLQRVLDFIEQNRDKKMSLILSGDTGFYSMLTFMRKHFKANELNVIPGISSVQYMFAKVSSYWNDAFVSSVHGRNTEYVEKLREYGKIGLLTDKKNTPQRIAEEVVKAGMTEATIYVGENLSYENEKIWEMPVKEMMEYERDFEMNVVLVFLQD
ncbi:precorrin-6y C5,15-methyltransferase subunit CbiE [Leptotrichia hofstadii]|uniref:Precorrin-6y C5,15-methyltransferase (Decarboxylating), CbiE subunit n=2 Tax=Leptotrichia hofstadii TaxID=157688 RepID=C9MYD7_9FUSO|nr:precorrin-6y C5,15-methyltransferase (decarboxylating) subunit CbiE [Leptotrichia hofstadii]EEX74517.1 precorrin-6y C5,15-methyltransferase (decarboxylating), CbiE subunit [Leptotrichia hofstadii F0254]BBM37931.1 precorrin-6y C5,15-methyltransferase subunit CbiE [Leptotrichia hofstadii]